MRLILKILAVIIIIIMFSLLAGLWDYFYRQREYNILILGVEMVRNE